MFWHQCKAILPLHVTWNPRNDAHIHAWIQWVDWNVIMNDERVHVFSHTMNWKIVRDFGCNAGHLSDWWWWVVVACCQHRAGERVSIPCAAPMIQCIRICGPQPSFLLFHSRVGQSPSMGSKDPYLSIPVIVLSTGSIWGTSALAVA